MSMLGVSPNFARRLARHRGALILGYFSAQSRAGQLMVLLTSWCGAGRARLSEAASQHRIRPSSISRTQLRALNAISLSASVISHLQARGSSTTAAATPHLHTESIAAARLCATNTIRYSIRLGVTGEGAACLRGARSYFGTHHPILANFLTGSLPSVLPITDSAIDQAHRFRAFH